MWVDPSPVPDDIVATGLAENLVDDPIAQEAIKASAHFGYDPTATYIVLTPPTTIATGQPVYCGYHSQTSSVDGLGNPYRIQYAFIPWLNGNWPGIGPTGCGMHYVNQGSNAFGNGIFDGYSIVTGHEYAEAVTDPDNIASWQDGWLDTRGNENGDSARGRRPPVRRAAAPVEPGVRLDRQRLRRLGLGTGGAAAERPPPELNAGTTPLACRSPAPPRATRGTRRSRRTATGSVPRRRRAGRTRG